MVEQNITFHKFVKAKDGCRRKTIKSKYSSVDKYYERKYGYTVRYLDEEETKIAESARSKAIAYLEDLMNYYFKEFKEEDIKRDIG